MAQKGLETVLWSPVRRVRAGQSHSREALVGALLVAFLWTIFHVKVTAIAPLPMGQLATSLVPSPPLPPTTR